MLKKLFAVAVSTFIFVLSPGIGAYDAAAKTIAAPQANTAGATAVIGNAAFGFSGVGTLGSAPSLAAPTLETTLPVLESIAIPSAAGIQAAPSVVSETRAAAALAVPNAGAAPAASAAITPKAKARTAAVVHRTVTGFSKTLKAVSGVSEAAPGDAHTMGVSLENTLTGVRSRKDGSTVLPVSGRFASIRSGLNAADSRRQFAKPAGAESIAAAIRAANLTDGDAAAAPAPKGHSAPLAARIFATLVAALPAVVLGAPLILGGSMISGGLIAAASLGLMAMPFFGQKTSGLIRRAPGFAVMALGAFSAGAAVFGLGLGALSTAPFWMGALVALGGWGLVRFGAQPDKEYFDEGKVITAFFGGLAAVAGVGLVALGPVGVLSAVGMLLPGVAASTWAGWAVTGATWLSFPLAGMLLMHLPGWVGEGIGAAVNGIYRSVRGALRTALSIHRDTVMRDRLEAWTEKKLELNKWNFWKVAAVWAPILVAEAVMGLAAIAVGTVLGIVQAVPMFLWGASDALAPESGATKFFASWNRTVFFNAQGSKKRIYNRFAKPLIAAANSESAVKSWGAGALLRLLQVGWLTYAVAATPFLHIGGFLKAFTQTGAEYDDKIHRPGSMRIDRDDSPVEKPEIDKDKPVRDMIPAGLIATALAVVPLYFFGLPLLGAPLIGVPYMVLGAFLAAIPVLPASTPKFVRQLPGWVMVGFGLLTVVAVPYMSFGPSALMAAVTANPFWFGLVTLLSGFGFVHNISKLAEGRDGKVWSADDPEYIGAFLGSLGILTGAGLAFAGVTGAWLTALMAASYLASGLLLMHLPKWFWTGVGSVFQGGLWSVRSFHKFFDFWGRDTKFRKNMRSHAKYYLDGSIWKIIGNSTWLSLIWVPTGLVWLAEAALAVAAGVLVGAVRAPLNWAWGALYEMDEDARITRFFAGWARHSNEWVEGETGRSRIFLGLLEKLGLTAAMNESVSPSGRPSVKAVLAFIGARIIQILWLAAFLGVVLPATFVTGIFAGIKNATGVKKPPSEDSEEWYQDRDDPDSLF